MAGYLHHDGVDALVAHPFQEPVQVHGLGGGDRVDTFLPDHVVIVPISYLLAAASMMDLTMCVVDVLPLVPVTPPSSWPRLRKPERRAHQGIHGLPRIGHDHLRDGTGQRSSQRNDQAPGPRAPRRRARSRRGRLLRAPLCENGTFVRLARIMNTHPLSRSSCGRLPVFRQRTRRSLGFIHILPCS